MQQGQDAAQRVDRVNHRAAETARVQVDGGAVQGYLGIAQAAQPIGDRRPVDAQHVGVRDHADIGRKLVAVGIEKSIQVRAAALLLALEEEGDTHRQAAVHRLPGAQGLDDAHELALIVDCAAGDDTRAVRTLDQHRVERRPAPRLDRVRGLDIVVAVVEQMRRTGRGQPVVCHDHGHAAGRPQAGVHAEAGQLIGEPARAGQRVAGMRGVDPDAGETQQLLQSHDAVREAGVDPAEDATRVCSASSAALPP